MRRSRPYIPLAIKLAVAERQAIMAPMPGANKRDRLQGILAMLFGSKEVQLDHTIALVNRKFNPRTGRYTPDANNPDFLVWRTKEDHDIKTRVRGDGAQHSDLALRRKSKRIARNRELKPDIPKAVGHFLVWKRAQQRKRARIAQRKRAWPKRKFGRPK